MRVLAKAGAGAAAGALLAAAACAGAASAEPGQRPFAVVYPVAAPLCASVAGGTNPHPRIQQNAGAVTAACQALEGSFNQAVATFNTAASSFEEGLAADKAAISEACTPTIGYRAACRSARVQEHRAIRALRREHRRAADLYHVQIHSSRHVFWATMRTVRRVRRP